ncbi:MAG: hypothetical protein JO121_07790 [Deltaproteobacteria bacterium]|nr:hypothetical protein [Deltaproteobacteria bacterium]
MPDYAEHSLTEWLLNNYLETHGGKAPRETHFDRRRSIFGSWDVGWAAASTAPIVGDGRGDGVTFLMKTVTTKVAASNMSDKKAAQNIIAAADNAIAEYLDSDDICPRWPFPGPPPWLVSAASELTLIANTFQEGPLRTEILNVAGLVLDRAQQLAQGSTAVKTIAKGA